MHRDFWFVKPETRREIRELVKCAKRGEWRKDSKGESEAIDRVKVLIQAAVDEVERGGDEDPIGEQVQRVSRNHQQLLTVWL